MKDNFILRLLLGLHLVGLLTMAGATLIDYFTNRTFWKLAQQDSHSAFGLLPVMSGYGAFVRAGAIMLILSGVLMFILVKGAWWQHRWFRVKMLLLALLVINGLLVGNRQGHRSRNMAYKAAPDFIQQAAGVRAALNVFYISQLSLFFVIILISTIKFDQRPG